MSSSSSSSAAAVASVVRPPAAASAAVEHKAVEIDPLVKFFTGPEVPKGMRESCEHLMNRAFYVHPKRTAYAQWRSVDPQKRAIFHAIAFIPIIHTFIRACFPNDDAFSARMASCVYTKKDRTESDGDAKKRAPLGDRSVTPKEFGPFKPLVYAAHAIELPTGADVDYTSHEILNATKRMMLIHGPTMAKMDNAFVDAHIGVRCAVELSCLYHRHLPGNAVFKLVDPVEAQALDLENEATSLQDTLRPPSNVTVKTCTCGKPLYGTFHWLTLPMYAVFDNSAGAKIYQPPHSVTVGPTVGGEYGIYSRCAVVEANGGVVDITEDDQAPMTTVLNKVSLVAYTLERVITSVQRFSIK